MTSSLNCSKTPPDSIPIEEAAIPKIVSAAQLATLVSTILNNPPPDLLAKEYAQFMANIAQVVGRSFGGEVRDLAYGYGAKGDRRTEWMVNVYPTVDLPEDGGVWEHVKGGL